MFHRRVFTVLRLVAVLASAILQRTDGKELMRARCSACKCVATELEEWLVPPPRKRLYDIEYEESNEFRDKKKDVHMKKSELAEKFGEAQVFGEERHWKPLPKRVSEFDAIELVEGLCKKMEEYELLGRDTLATDVESVKMIWIKADPDNMAHKVNPRVGIERLEIVQYCNELLERVEEPLIDRLQDELVVQSTFSLLCEEVSQECVGDPKARLQEKLKRAEAARKLKKKIVFTQKPNKEPNKNKDANVGQVVWTALGVGCCAELNNNEWPWLFNDHLGSLEACQRKCETTPKCGFATHGWEHAPTWCVLSEGCSLPLDDGPAPACGSTGDNGVEVHKLVRDTLAARREL